MTFFRQERRAQRLTFGSGDRPVGWGSSTRRGGGRKVRASLESLSSLGFEGRNLECPGNFAGMSRIPGGVQKVCAKKISFCAFFALCVSLCLCESAVASLVITLGTFRDTNPPGPPPPHAQPLNAPIPGTSRYIGVCSRRGSADWQAHCSELTVRTAKIADRTFMIIIFYYRH